MATATKTSQTLAVTCPFCMATEATVRLDLNDLRICVCSNCDEEFSPADAVDKLAAMAARWLAVAEWVDLAPTV